MKLDYINYAVDSVVSPRNENGSNELLKSILTEAMTNLPFPDVSKDSAIEKIYLGYSLEKSARDTINNKVVPVRDKHSATIKALGELDDLYSEEEKDHIAKGISSELFIPLMSSLSQLAYAYSISDEPLRKYLKDFLKTSDEVRKGNIRKCPSYRNSIGLVPKDRIESYADSLNLALKTVSESLIEMPTPLTLKTIMKLSETALETMNNDLEVLQELIERATDKSIRHSNNIIDLMDKASHMTSFTGLTLLLEILVPPEN